jgi:hypothetical protein
MAAGGGANGVPDARYCTTADRRRLLMLVLVDWPVRREERRRKKGVAATSAMWPAVLPGGRPVGRRAATRGSTLVVLPQRSGGLSLTKAAGHRQVADFNVERP